MAFNRSKREIAQEQRYLSRMLGQGNIERCEAARQRALRDAMQVVQGRYRGQGLTLVDYHLRPSLESRNPDGWCEVGMVLEERGERRGWLIRWNVVTGARVLRRMR